MQYFNFRNLIRKYSREFTVVIKGEKELNAAGDWVYGENKQITLYGAIIGFAERKIFRAEGTLTEQDKALHMLQPIENALIGSTVIFNGNVYRLETQKGKDNADFTGVYSYTLKFQSAFNEGVAAND